MLTFFRRIRLRLLGRASSDTFRKGLLGSGQARKPASPASRYLLYAVGEISLVVIGILIALQINNWNEYRKDRAKEREVLLQLKRNLNYNLLQIDSDSADLYQKIHSIEIIVDHLVKKGYHDSLGYHLFAPFSSGITKLTSSAYENLKSIGLEIIQSDDLREHIINLYEITYESLQTDIREALNNWEQQMIVPYYAENFSDKQGIGLIPNDFEKLREDEKFMNLLTLRQGLWTFMINTLAGAKNETQAVIHEIDKDIGKIIE